MNSQDDGTEPESTESGLALKLVTIVGAIILLAAVITMFVY